jgi:hypothetical protein
MVASGLVLWTVKRREKLADPARPHFGFRLVAWLNVSVVAGFPFAIAAMLWANRLLPTGLQARAETEIQALFMAWAIALALAALLPERRAWTVLLSATGSLLAALPVYNIVATTRGLPTTVRQGDFMLAGIDATLLVFGVGFWLVARRVARHAPEQPRRRRSPSSATNVAIAKPEPVG